MRSVKPRPKRPPRTPLVRVARLEEEAVVVLEEAQPVPAPPATALVIGRARQVWEEVAALQAMVEFDATIVVGKAAVDYPGRIDYWVTFHVNLFARWMDARRARGYPDAGGYWSAIYRGKPIKESITFPPIQRVVCEGGSSGLIGVVVALEAAGADRVALAGIPMENERGHYDEKKEWKEAQNYRAAWKEIAPRLIGRVRSMSGWTMELLGGRPPTREWLLGLEE